MKYIFILIAGYFIIITMEVDVCSNSSSYFSRPDLNTSYISSADPVEHNRILVAGLALTDVFLDSVLSLDLLNSSLANEFNLQDMQG